MKIEGRRGVSAGVRPIPLWWLVMLGIALGAFLFDFVTPVTPTPIALVHGMQVPRPSIVAVFEVSPILRMGGLPVAEEVFAVLASHSADPLDLNCRRRC